ncbi:MAG: hypothetical protein ABFD46_03125 [Armatimonadota bacterium]
MKDKQTSQVIVFGILVAVCVAFVVMKVASSSKPVSAKTQTKQKAAAATGKTSNNGESTAALDDSSVIDIHVASSSPAARRDPFAPTMDTVGKDIQYIPPIRKLTQMPGMNTHPINTPVMPLPVLPVGAGPQNAAQAVPTGRVVNAPEAEAFPAFVLTGVITGRTNVAIIRLEDSRYIAKEGQLINGKYKVVSVSSEGVRLDHGGRSVFLKLGGEGNAN